MRTALTHFVVLGSLVGLACQPPAEQDAEAGTDTKGARCNLRGLSVAAEAVASASLRAQASMAWAGIAEACQGAVPSNLQEVFGRAGGANEGADSEEMLKLAGCTQAEQVASELAQTPAPERARVAFERCAFAGRELLAPEQVAGPASGAAAFVAHAWLREQGLAAEPAAILARGLYAAEQYRGLGLGMQPSLELPQASGGVLGPGLAVYVTSWAVVIGGEEVVALDDGAWVSESANSMVMKGVFEGLVSAADAAHAADAERNEPQGAAKQLWVLADRSTPLATLLPLLYTAKRLGLENFGLVVDAGAYAPLQIAVDSPPLEDQSIYRTRGPKSALPQMAANHDPDRQAALHDKKRAAEPEVMTIEIGTELLTLAHGAGADFEPSEAPRAALDVVAAYAKGLREADPEARRAVISGAAGVTVQDVLELAQAVRGSECDADPSRCVLPEIQLVSDGAHRYDTGRGLDENFVIGEVGDPNWEVVYTGEPSKPQQVQDTAGERGLEVSGGLDKSAIRRIVKAYLGPMKGCYRAELAKDPSLGGRIEVEFVINAKGKVSSVAIASDTVGNEAVATCLTKDVRTWVFPHPVNGGIVSVRYPIVLTAG